MDGLTAEREQGITIDVAYNYFSTPRRKFIIADTPGHEQYTRNMVTGASTADAAVILVDARRGPTEQTRRHLYLSHLLGVPHLIVAVNKMDLVGFDERAYAAIALVARRTWPRALARALSISCRSRRNTATMSLKPARAWPGTTASRSWPSSRPCRRPSARIGRRSASRCNMSAGSRRKRAASAAAISAASNPAACGWATRSR